MGNKNKKSQYCILCNIVIMIVLLSCAFARQYERIISLAPSITESIYELGAEQFLKGITVYCPQGTIKKEIIGTLIEFNIEKIISLNPDLIISTKDGNNKSAVERLKHLGFEVYVMENSKSFNDICVNYYSLAKKLNRTKKAKRIILVTKSSIDKIYKNLKKSSLLKVFWEIGTKPLYTAGHKSFINDYNYYTKTINIYKNINMCYLAVDLNDLIERNPDIIILVNMGHLNKEKITKWNKYKTISAVKNNKIFMIHTINDNIFAPTPLTFVKNVTVLVKFIYGDCNAK
jgi:iron complex transport system substrate-binding protein